MKQPDLGRKISELRKIKGFTQEELVDKCNISVRTLQRIETGLVMPRSYTIRTIFAALDYDIGRMIPDENTAGGNAGGWFRTHILLDIDRTTPVEFIIRQLTIAWIAGILWFFLGFFEGAAEHFRYSEERLVFSTPVYIAMKISVLISFIFFQRGFILLGAHFSNYALRILSFVLLIGTIAIIGYDIASIFYDAAERKFILGAEAFTFGGILIVYGFSLVQLRKHLGGIARFAGVFEILTGCFFITIVLAFIGFFTAMPADLLEILILFKSIDVIKSVRAPVGVGAESLAPGS